MAAEQISSQRQNRFFTKMEKYIYRRNRAVWLLWWIEEKPGFLSHKISKFNENIKYNCGVLYKNMFVKRTMQRSWWRFVKKSTDSRLLGADLRQRQTENKNIGGASGWRQFEPGAHLTWIWKTKFRFCNGKRHVRLFGASLVTTRLSCLLAIYLIEATSFNWFL